ncbi:MAG: hypothetical protein LBM63_01660 [Rikenellaceae bacterium]|nr:hypothetical protein [Rikenellaceae bacterium]
MKKSSESLKNIEVNTLTDPESIGRIEPTKPTEAASFKEVEQDTILINPDMESMESRG